MNAEALYPMWKAILNNFAAGNAGR
jgi:hypothetical protein